MALYRLFIKTSLDSRGRINKTIYFRAVPFSVASCDQRSRAKKCISNDPILTLSSPNSSTLRSTNSQSRDDVVCINSLHPGPKHLHLPAMSVWTR